MAGAGYVGRAHAAALEATSHCVLSALVDPAPAAAAIAERARVPLFRSLEELLARHRPDGVVLATPNALHVPQALACIDAGLPVLLENVAGARTSLLSGAECFVPPLAEIGVSGSTGFDPLMCLAAIEREAGGDGRLAAVVFDVQALARFFDHLGDQLAHRSGDA